LIAAFYAQTQVAAQDTTNQQSSGNSSMQAVPSANASTPPALNVITPTARPDIPPPPETPQQFAATRSLTAAPPSMPQAWRLKALQLFKANNSLDKNSIFTTRLQTTYDSAFEALRSALAEGGLKLEALSLSSGHMLVSRPSEGVNGRGTNDRAVLSLRQAALDSDSPGSASATDVRVFCDCRNRSLTLAQLKAILGQVNYALAGGKDRAGDQNL
jgi:hypothetical protein